MVKLVLWYGGPNLQSALTPSVPSWLPFHVFLSLWFLEWLVVTCRAAVSGPFNLWE